MSQKKQATLLLATTFGSVALNFTMIPIFLRVMGLENFGLYSILLAVIYATTFFDFFRNPYISEKRNGATSLKVWSDSRKIFFYVCRRYYFVLFLLPIIAFFLDDFAKVMMFLCLASVPFYILSSILLAEIESENKTGSASLIRFLGWIVFYGSILLIAYTDFSPIYYPSPYLLMTLTLFFSSYYFLYSRQIFNVSSFWKDNDTNSRHNKKAFEKHYINKLKKQAQFYFFASMQGAFERFIVVSTTSLVNFSIYNAFTEVINKGQFFPRLINTYFFPRLNSNEEHIKTSFIRFYFVLFFSFSCLSLILWFGRDLLFKFYFTEEMSDYSIYFYLALICLMLKFLGYQGVLYLNLLGDFKTQENYYRLTFLQQSSLEQDCVIL